MIAQNVPAQLRAELERPRANHRQRSPLRRTRLEDHSRKRKFPTGNIFKVSLIKGIPKVYCQKCKQYYGKRNFKQHLMTDFHNWSGKTPLSANISPPSINSKVALLYLLMLLCSALLVLIALRQFGHI